MSELVKGCWCLAGIGRESVILFLMVLGNKMMVLGNKMMVVVMEMITMVGMVMFGHR